MENKENPMQPEPELSIDEQLDLLLEKFLAEDTEEVRPEAPETPIAEEAEPESAAEESPAAEEAEVAEEPEMEEEASAEELPSTVEDIPSEADAPQEDAPITQEAVQENPVVDAPELSAQNGPEEAAIADAQLSDSDDLDFEKIMEETLLEAAEADAETDAEDKEKEEDFSLDDIYFLPVDAQPATEDAPVEKPADAQENPQQELQQDESPEEEPEAPEDSADAQEAEVEDAFRRQPKKRRPKNGSTYGFFGIPHMIVTAIWLALILFIGAGLGIMVWDVAADMLAFDRPNQTITITITASDDLDSIAKKLHDTGLIQNPGMFKIYGALSNAEKKIKPGTYELNTIYDYMALVKNMSGTADRVSTTVMIPEGYTCEQIFRLLEKNGVCTVEAMEEAVMNADLSEYWFLEGVDQSDPNCLEGFLFPDTYTFYLDHDPNAVLARLLNNFDKRFTDAMREKLDTLNENLADMMRSHGLSESYIQEHLFTVKELVIVASMIEKETSGDEESYYISSVIYNRLTNPGEYPYLNIDATLVYITGNSSLTQEDLKIDSPYNTYLYKGLIPGAISNPGLASLNAALAPENTEYYYYALDPEAGVHKFFKTYKAHQNFLESLKKGE